LDDDLVLAASHTSAFLSVMPSGISGQASLT
jgi:hypothetical protein